MNCPAGSTPGGNSSAGVSGWAGGSWIPAIRKPASAKDVAIELSGRWKKVRSTLVPAKS